MKNLKIKISVALAGLFLLALVVGVARAQFMQGETVPQSQAVLDSYFASNAVPNQLQYWELIDTMYYYVEAAYTNTLAAQMQTSNSANAIAASYILTISNSTGANGFIGIMHNNGIASNTFSYGGGIFEITNWFINPMQDVNYAPTIAYQQGSWGIAEIYSNTAYVVFQSSYPSPPDHQYGQDYVVIYR
jgi:hypothetical protein